MLYIASKFLGYIFVLYKGTMVDRVLKLILFSLCLILSVISLKVFSITSVNTTIVNKENGVWLVTYEAEQPVQQLVFKSSPNHSRGTRWRATEKEYGIVYHNSREYIRRLDGLPFTKVTFYLTPSYVSLPKEYAPFSPFTDGGVLLHSGRFFVCPELCSNYITQWRIKLQAPATRHIILKGALKRQEVVWQSTNDGEKIYVGPNITNENKDFITVIDPGLPTKAQQYLDKYLPLIMTQYASRFAALAEKPMLFASYSSTDNGTYGNQGGVLANQVFMHWYGKIAHLGINEVDTLWFFSHEIAHLFQGAAAGIVDHEHAWIHEGMAEFMASITLTELLPHERSTIVDRVSKAQSRCITDLKGYALVDSGNRRKFNVYYTCGLLINQAIHNEANKLNPAVTGFTIWQAFQDSVNKGNATSSRTFLAAVKPFVSSEFFAQLQRIILPQNTRAATDIEQLIKMSQQ